MEGIAPGRGDWLLALGFEGVKACACGASVDPVFPDTTEAGLGLCGLAHEPTPLRAGGSSRSYGTWCGAVRRRTTRIGCL